MEIKLSYQLLKAISDDLVQTAGTHKYVRSSLFGDLEPPPQIAIILEGARGIIQILFLVNIS